MPKCKYPQGYRTAREFISAIKSAPSNVLFFSRDTMRFFGRQKFSMVDATTLQIEFTDPDKCPRVSLYAVDSETLKLTTVNK